MCVHCVVCVCAALCVYVVATLQVVKPEPRAIWKEAGALEASRSSEEDEEEDEDDDDDDDEEEEGRGGEG